MNEEIKSKAVELTDEQMETVDGGMQRILEYNHGTQVITTKDCMAYYGTMDNFYKCCFQHMACSFSGTIRYGCTGCPKFYNGVVSWDLKVINNLDVNQLVLQNRAMLVND